MKNMIFLLVATCCVAQVGWAQEQNKNWSFSIGARTWYENWTYENTDTGEEYTAMEDVFLLGPVVSVRYKKMTLSLNIYSGSYRDQDISEGRTYEIERQRDDIDLILTYKIFAPLSIGVGYKHIGDSGQRQRTILQDPQYTFDKWEWDGGHGGLVVGLSLNHYLYRQLFFSGMGSYSWLTYDSEGERWHQDFANPANDYYRTETYDPVTGLHAVTFEIAGGVTMFKHLAVLAGYRYQHIGPAKEGWWPDTIKGPVVGIHFIY